jgi:hypothetical protein
MERQRRGFGDTDEPGALHLAPDDLPIHAAVDRWTVRHRFLLPIHHDERRSGLQEALLFPEHPGSVFELVVDIDEIREVRTAAGGARSRSPPSRAA